MRLTIPLILALSATPLAAQEWTDLVGTWTGTSRAVVSGAGGHYTPSETSKPVFVSADLTIVFTEQDQGRYIGTVTSGNSTEPKIAVVSDDRKAIFTVDSDGQSTGRMLDVDHMELCYTQSSSADKQMVASCVVFVRKTDN